MGWPRHKSLPHPRLWDAGADHLELHFTCGRDVATTGKEQRLVLC